MLSLLLSSIILVMIGCSENNPSKTSYWFSDARTEFVAYDDTANNLSEAGNYWYFTSAKDMEIEMYLRVDASDFYSTTRLYVNGEQVGSETDTGVYTYAYILSLKKGDNIKIHAFWTNSLKTTEDGFEMQLIGIRHDGATYLLEEYNKLK